MENCKFAFLKIKTISFPSCNPVCYQIHPELHLLADNLKRKPGHQPGLSILYCFSFTFTFDFTGFSVFFISGFKVEASLIAS